MEALLGKAAGRAWRTHTFGVGGPDEGEEEADEEDASGGLHAVGAAAGAHIEGAAAEPAAAAAGAQQHQAMATAAVLAEHQHQHQQPSDPNKLRLAQLGSKDPANVSWALLAELRARAQLAPMLAAVAGELRCKGQLPQQLGRRAALRITRSANKRWVGTSCGQVRDTHEGGGREVASLPLLVACGAWREGGGGGAFTFKVWRAAAAQACLSAA